MRVAVAALVCLALMSAGCAARPRGRAIATAARERDARDGPRGGWVTLGRHGRNVALRDDAPTLESVWAARAQAEPPTYEHGPQGATGDVGPAEAYGAPAYLVPVYPNEAVAYGGFYGPFWAPGGAVPPGLRTPSDVRAFAAPYGPTLSAGDVAAHRPGLSTGSAFFGRGAR